MNEHAGNRPKNRPKKPHGKPPVDPSTAFGRLLVDAIARRKINRVKLAGAVGISPATVYDWIQGRSRPRRFSHLLAVCEILKIRPLEALEALAADEQSRQI